MLRQLVPTCQFVTESDWFCDVHIALERAACSTQEATDVLRAALLFTIHRLRSEDPSKPFIIFTQRSLTSVWRTCPLLHEALPGAKQVLQWQRIDNVIASFDEATRVYMICPFARAMHKSGAEWKLWKNGGNQRETHGIGRLLRRMTKEMAEDPLIALDVARLQDVAASRDSDDELDQQPWLLSIDSRMDTSQFAHRGILGFGALSCIYSFHVSAALAPSGVWAATMSYEELLEHKSHAILDLLEEIGFVRYISSEVPLRSV